MIVNIEALRGLAALSVVLFHLSPLLNQIGITQLGGGGVDLFFVISGFIMVHIAQQRPITPARFLINRCLRIVPLYWLVTLSVFGMALIAPSLFKSVHTDIDALLGSLFFIPMVQDGHVVDPVLFLGWTLNYEMFFYVLFAATLWIDDVLWRSLLMVAVLMVLVLSGMTNADLSPVAAFYCNPLVFEFALGIMLALAIDHAPEQAKLWAKISMVLIGLAALVACLFPDPQLRDTYRLFVTGIPAFCLVGSALLLERWGWRWDSPLGLVMGKASYALYLTHIFVTGTALALSRWLQSDALFAFAITTISTGLSVLLAVALSHHLEPRLRALMSAPVTPPSHQGTAY